MDTSAPGGGQRGFYGSSSASSTSASSSRTRSPSRQESPRRQSSARGSKSPRRTARKSKLTELEALLDLMDKTPRNDDLRDGYVGLGGPAGERGAQSQVCLRSRIESQQQGRACVNGTNFRGAVTNSSLYRSLGASITLESTYLLGKCRLRK